MTNAYDASLLDPNQAPEEPAAPEPAQSGSPYDGMIAENAQGHRVVYRGNAQGHGRWVDLNSTTAPTNVRTMLGQEQGRLQTAIRTAELANDFLQHNAHRTTGGLRDAPWVPDWGDTDRQAMEGLSSSMVRANIQPGMAQTMNSDAEAAMARGQYPSPTVVGPINQQRALELFVARDTQQRRVNEMERWLSQHPSLDHFAEYWGSIEPQVRDEAVRRNRPLIYSPGATIGADVGRSTRTPPPNAPAQPNGQRQQQPAPTNRPDPLGIR